MKKCSRIAVRGAGFINSTLLRCRVKVSSSSYYAPARAGSQWVTTGVEYVNPDRIVCLVHDRLVVAGSLVELQVTNDGFRMASAGSILLYDSRCRICGVPADPERRPRCKDREDVCFLPDGSCVQNMDANPHDPCQVCRVERKGSWIVTGRRKQSWKSPQRALVYDGQTLQIMITDSSGSTPAGVSFHLAVADQDQAELSPQGLFRWTPVLNALSLSTHEVFPIVVQDRCLAVNASQETIFLEVHVLPCPCHNGGSCQSLSESSPGDNGIPSYHCQCPAGFTGRDCHARINFCEPNPCKDGLCLNQGSGFTCQCFPGFAGARCDNSQGLSSQQDRRGSPHRNRLSTTTTTSHERRCPPGFSGRHCRKPALPNCAMPCLNKGKCVKGDVCSCRKGWQGSQCENPVCTIQCLNGAVCSAPDKCSCPPGFRGSNCDKGLEK